MDDDPIESDENDDDYFPSEEEEEESDDALGSDYELEEASWKIKTKGKRKRKQTRSRTSPRKRKVSVKLEKKKEKEEDESENDSDDKVEEVAKATEDTPAEKPVEEEKKKADSLWADFLKDVDPPPKSRHVSSSKSQTQTKELLTDIVDTKKTTITQVFDFAGESVSVTKEVDVESEEAQQQIDSKDEEEKCGEEASKANSGGVKRPGSLGNVLGQIMGKKSKLTTLEKSRLDWENFKKEENIEDELRLHNKGKDGYLERQAFLQRVDVRQFEIEKDIRAMNRSKR